MSKFAKRVRDYFDAGLWNDEMVRNAVLKGRITKDEYAEIVGEPYPEEG